MKPVRVKNDRAAVVVAAVIGAVAAAEVVAAAAVATVIDPSHESVSPDSIWPAFRDLPKLPEVAGC